MRRFDTRFRFPVSLFLYGVDNFIEPAGKHTVFSAVLRFSPLARLARGSARKIKEHITEELEEMKEILEGRES